MRYNSSYFPRNTCSVLTDVSNKYKQNDGVRFNLIAVDGFSRYLWVYPLRKTLHESISDGLSKIFKSGQKLIKLQTDKGRRHRRQSVDSMMIS